MAFDPTAHLVKLKGNALYLPVTWRLVWLREEHPDAVVETEMVTMDLDRGLYVFRATVTLPNGASATGYGSETEKDFPVAPLEKAETKALGRALAALGLGTQFALEIEESEGVGAEGARGTAPTRTLPAARPAPASTPHTRALAAAEKAVAAEKAAAEKAAGHGDPPIDPDEQKQRTLLRQRLGVAFPDLTVSTWRELVSFAHETYDLEVPTPEQDRDPEFRMGYLTVLLGRIPHEGVAEEVPTGANGASAAEYRARLLEASSVAAISSIMHKAREAVGAEVLRDLSALANERTKALREGVPS